MKERLEAEKVRPAAERYVKILKAENLDLDHERAWSIGGPWIHDGKEHVEGIGKGAIIGLEVRNAVAQQEEASRPAVVEDRLEYLPCKPITGF